MINTLKHIKFIGSSRSLSDISNQLLEFVHAIVITVAAVVVHGWGFGAVVAACYSLDLPCSEVYIVLDDWTWLSVRNDLLISFGNTLI